MTPTDTLRSSGQILRPGPAELAPARLAILAELQVSLEASQKALLARDLDGIEQGTREQVRLQRALALLERPHAGPAGDSVDQKSGSQPEVQLPPALASTQTRLVHLARVQAALIARAQRSAKMMARLLAGPGVAYGPNREMVLGASPPSGEGEEHGCRA
jgi:hypothetical protein